MTTVRCYRNKRNDHKVIEVHNDGHYHNSVRQKMVWSTDGRTIVNKLGDGCLHRWRRANLDELLDDYIEI